MLRQASFSTRLWRSCSRQKITLAAQLHASVAKNGHLTSIQEPNEYANPLLARFDSIALESSWATRAVGSDCPRQVVTAPTLRAEMRTVWRWRYQAWPKLHH